MKGIIRAAARSLGLGFSTSCVVEIFTTAGSTFFEIPAKALESMTGSGMASNEAPLDD